MSLSPEHVIAALATYPDPYLPQQNLVDRGAISGVTVEGGVVSFCVKLGYPAAGIRDTILASLTEVVKTLPDVTEVNIDLQWAIAASQTPNDIPAMGNVKNIIAVASGKGGVGKSTTSVNLALALAAEGARVGLLDADIYGPSQPIMLGIPEDARPETDSDKFFKPIPALGLQTMSMGYLVTDKTPMVWRGPMVSGALQQMLSQTLWQDIDYLVVDMPPGTGDIQLTLAQKVPVTGSVVVTTPQDIALLDAVKGIEMFHKVNIPVVGIVENMALHRCSECGHIEHLFGEGGGEKVAAEYGVPLLGSLPLELKIRQQTDAGKPTVADEPESETSLIYREIARRAAASIAGLGRDTTVPEIIIKSH